MFHCLRYACTVLINLNNLAFCVMCLNQSILKLIKSNPGLVANIFGKIAWGLTQEVFSFNSQHFNRRRVSVYWVNYWQIKEGMFFAQPSNCRYQANLTFSYCFWNWSISHSFGYERCCFFLRWITIYLGLYACERVLSVCQSDFSFNDEINIFRSTCFFHYCLTPPVSKFIKESH